MPSADELMLQIAEGVKYTTLDHYIRLPFRLTVAPLIFQKWTGNFDDIIITKEPEQEHKGPAKRIKSDENCRGQCKREDVCIFKDEVRFLGDT